VCADWRKRTQSGKLVEGECYLAQQKGAGYRPSVPERSRFPALGCPCEHARTAPGSVAGGRLGLRFTVGCGQYRLRPSTALSAPAHGQGNRLLCQDDHEKLSAGEPLPGNHDLRPGFVPIDGTGRISIVGISDLQHLGLCMTDDDDEPNLVASGKSQVTVVDGVRFSIEIYRLETDPAWTLEVVDPEGTSHVWEEQFVSDKDARNVAIKAIETEGAAAFMRGDNVIPFRP